MKTILFAQPNSPLVQKLQQEGREFILAQDPIKTLKAMKQIHNKGDYEVMGDEESTKYLEYSRKLSYNVYSEPKPEPTKIEAREDKKEEESIKHEVLLETTITTLSEGYKRKLEKESHRLKEEYDAKFKTMQEEHEKKVKELEVEKNKFKKIKEKIKEELYK